MTDSNPPPPLPLLWQPRPTACLTATGAASEAPSLLMHPRPPPLPVAGQTSTRLLGWLWMSLWLGLWLVAAAAAAAVAMTGLLLGTLVHNAGTAHTARAHCAACGAQSGDTRDGRAFNFRGRGSIQPSG